MSDLSTLDARKQLAGKYAAKYDLLPELVCAVVEQESSWSPWAIRYEPAFYTRYVMPLGLPETEARARSISWGLCQIMGEVARELGFVGPMASLCDPDTGLEWGCRKLKKCFDAVGGDTQKALLHWNGGGNPDYPAQVVARVEKYK
jgi:soluble lytic murein transglycosylase-like protein